MKANYVQSWSPRWRFWLSGLFAKWSLRMTPNYRRWVLRWQGEAFMIVPRSWVKEECIQADRDWLETL